MDREEAVRQNESIHESSSGRNLAQHDWENSVSGAPRHHTQVKTQPRSRLLHLRQGQTNEGTYLCDEPSHEGHHRGIVSELPKQHDHLLHRNLIRRIGAKYIIH
jgi:hypothetical protein